MAKKKARKATGAKAKGTKARTARRKASVPPAGPLMLEQAQALAKARQPAATAKAAIVQPNPASVSIERKRLARRQDQEFKRRTREYKATLAIMKERGVKGLGPKPKAGQPAPQARPKPLQVLAEGDSWFDYPVPLFSGGVIA